MSAFSIFTSKKRRRERHSEPSPTEYYARIANRVSILKFVVLFVLVIFTAFGFTFYGKELTIENFRYMLKFMSVDRDAVMNAGKKIIYDSDRNTAYTLIRGDIAVINGSGIHVFDSAGQRLLRQLGDYNDPMAVTNDKHLIVADRSSNNLSIYSAYSLLYKQEYAYPITSIAGSKSSRYGVVTSALGYKSGVEIYDGEFRPIFKYYFRDKYTVRLAISDDGKTAIVASLINDENGDCHAYFYVFNPDVSAEPAKTFDFTDELPLNTMFFSNGNYTLMTGDALRFCDANGNVLKTVYFTSRTAKKYFASDEYFVLTFAGAGLSNATTIEIYDSNGEHVMSRNVENEVTRVDIVDEYLYYYSSGVLCTVDLKSRAEDKYDDIGVDYIKLLYEPDGNNIIMFYKNIAAVYNKDDFPTQKLIAPEQ